MKKSVKLLLNTIFMICLSFYAVNKKDFKLNRFETLKLFGQNITCSSIGVSPNDPTKIIYSITLGDISTPFYLSSLFSSGYNGFIYDISINNSSMNAYPLAGFYFNTIVTTILPYSISPRSVQFQFEGPYSSTENPITFTVNEKIFQLNSDKSQKSVAQYTSILPPYDTTSSTDSYYNYDVNIHGIYSIGANDSLPVFNNGTCAVPFLVQLVKNSDKTILPGSNSLYDNIIFTYQKDPMSFQYSIIGDDPFNSNTAGYAILPASSVEYSTGDVKYGVDGEILKKRYGEGRVFYLFCGANARDGGNVQAGLVDNNGVFATQAALNVMVIPVNDTLCSISTSISGNLENISLRGPSLEAGGTEDITYYSSDEYALFEKGYILPNYKFDNVNGNIYALYVIPNEVLSSQNLTDKYNWANLEAGYNIEPVLNGFTPFNKLDTYGYQWSKYIDGRIPRASYTSELSSIDLYDFLFSNYGTDHTYTMSQFGQQGNNYMPPLALNCDSSDPGGLYFTYSVNENAMPVNLYGLYVPVGKTVHIYNNLGDDKHYHVSVQSNDFWNNLQPANLDKGKRDF